ncbi:5-formyltetrahydrofolate cyclo-ligase [Gracilinema caldarium]|uniref:5-formyltetrahydrofolate cyclo-ligase n=1 Tax=Gracilinema caldarium (strain ATCC 51460 / DSM 7334 / H1) TaxID=744872 RepID=F8F375_GRAC1|nr:5-formyltetrahydrofolate cyclo-ligase [Gracilinema caldarium]AEJ20401.1 5-formyltetrahydrofolate cyclo-ligase [Gracilinema caldarium DSM 7334]
MGPVQGDKPDKSTLADLKQELRTIVKSRLKTLSPDNLHRAGFAAAERLKTHPRWQQARLVLLYASMSGEIDTEPLFHLAKTSGKTIFYPRVEGDEIGFYQVNELLDLESQGPWHILEPRPGLTSLFDWIHTICNTVEQAQTPVPILGIIPGLAFDRQGGRLGRGKGYYDRFLSSIEKIDFPYPLQLYTIGLSIPEQVVDQVPRSPYDIRVHEVMVIERGLTGDLPRA